MWSGLNWLFNSSVYLISTWEPNWIWQTSLLFTLKYHHSLSARLAGVVDKHFGPTFPTRYLKWKKKLWFLSLLISVNSRLRACKRHLLIGVDHVAMRPRYNAQRNWNCCDHFQTITRKIQEPLFSILALAIRCNQNTFNSLIKKNRLNGKPLNEYHLFVITVTKPWQFPIFKSSNLVLNFLNEVNIRFQFFFPICVIN